jgi:hypothetical protein
MGKSDVAETDIEIITKDRGVVRYTNHPGIICPIFIVSPEADERDVAYDAATDTLIAGATFKEPLTLPWSQLQEHKFEWIEGETRFYQDNVLKRTIRKNVPEHVCPHPIPPIKVVLMTENSRERL